MKRIIIMISTLILLSNLTACSSAQTPETEPAAIPAAVQETTEPQKEVIFYDSYNSSFPHFPVPESFVDVSVGAAGYSDGGNAFQYFPTEENTDIAELIDSYCMSLYDLGFLPQQEADGFIFLYSGDILVGAVEPQDSSFYVYCIVPQEQDDDDTNVMAISLNETAASAFAEVTPRTVAAGKQVSASDELFETTITSRNDNKCLIWLAADLHNMMDTTVEFQYNYYVRFLLDDHEPQEAKLVAAPGLPPDSEKNLVWYAEIPRNYLENCHSVTVRIGFLDQFQNMSQGQLADESTLLCDVVLTGDQIESLKNMVAE